MDEDKKRPWQGAETRLGLKIFGRDVDRLQQDNAGLGWVLLRLRPQMIDEGVEAVWGPDQLEMAELCDGLELTGAELRTLREDCGLSLSEAAVFFDVKERVVSRWENNEPPSGPACELVMLRAQIEAAAHDAADLYLRKLDEYPEISGVDIYRYRSVAYEETIHFAEGLPHGAHNRILSKTADILTAHGVSASIVYWHSDTEPEAIHETPP